MAGSFDYPSGRMFQGSIVALLTPFTEDGRIDLAALETLVSFHRDAGTHGLVVAGTTGESATLEDREFEELLAAVVRQAGGAIPVIAGTGSASTRHAIEQSRKAEALGADAVLVVTPYYNRPAQRGLVAHFRAVADAISIPVIVYNVPSRTGVDMQPEAAAALSAHPGIAGVKEAVSDIARVRELVARCGPEFAVLSGDDPSSLGAMKAGARGVISVAANIAPATMRAMCEAAAAGDWGRADALNDELADLYETLALESNPIPVKWAAFEMGLIGPEIRLPLTPLDPSHRETVRKCLERLEIAQAEA